MLNSLSGRFLVLTTVFVMLAEVLIFVPSIARFREDYLLTRLERAQIASLVLLADEDGRCVGVHEVLDRCSASGFVAKRCIQYHVLRQQLWTILKETYVARLCVP